MASASSEEWEVVDEKQLYLELQGVVDFPAETPVDRFDFINADSQKPLFKIGDFVYAGRYEDTVGSHMAFRIENCPAATADTAPRRKLHFAGKTDKVLKMAPACIRQKNKEDQSSCGS
ncbi:general transcription factor 3C polypeptide 6 [Galendromus occidentalis]|uniref:General transcription factor 3C polypeptide 6 n=1 Tax=Galendromus occidentalis TaxID=34638 RepID=A0AAJ6QR81_9ACAR|nr:general transcription factor 3C polypeptide 6 [Galendromus occidentalis]